MADENSVTGNLTNRAKVQVRQNVSRKTVSRLAVGLVAAALSVSLTACDPPMPPDVAAQILEQSYTCVEGEATAAFPQSMSDPAAQWSDSLLYSCTDSLPAMSLQSVAAADSPDLLVSSYLPDAQICEPNFSMPIAIEAGVVVFQLADSGSLNLSPKTLAKILNGEILNWSDAAIAKTNPGVEFPDLAISVRDSADRLAWEAISGWLKQLGQDVTKAKISSATENKARIDELAEGEIAIASHSNALEHGLYSVSVITGVHKETGEPEVAVADNLGIASAASQLKPNRKETTVSVNLDPNIKPLAQEGLNEAATPYQAIYPVFIYGCGQDSLLSHAVALFLLRLDSQGVLGASNYNPLPERVRYESLEVARTGLPTPSPLPEQD